MTDHSETAWEQDEIESHLRSAMDALTPNVFDKIDLSTPQEIYVKPSRRVRMYRRMRTVAMAAAACLCVAVLGGGVSFYQNHRVDSVIGIDVNPSIELSVNRNEKVLQANPLNEDAGSRSNPVYPIFCTYPLLRFLLSSRKHCLICASVPRILSSAFSFPYFPSCFYKKQSMYPDILPHFFFI